MTKENVAPVRTHSPYGPKYPTDTIRYSREGTRNKNIIVLPVVGDKKILPKIEVREVKSN